MRKLLVAITLVALTGLAPTPARADHANGAVCSDGTFTCGHWGNRYSPPVYMNVGGGTILSGGASAFDVVQDAGYFWQDNGFVQGWNPGAFPATGGPNCSGSVAGNSFVDGAIHVCFVPSWDPNLGGRAEQTSVTRFGRCDSACNHIYAATIWVATDASPSLRQYAMRHGMGHALGLGHHNSECGVMNVNYCTPFATADDRAAMWTEYGSHVRG